MLLNFREKTRFFEKLHEKHQKWTLFDSRELTPPTNFSQMYVRALFLTLLNGDGSKFFKTSENFEIE